MNTYGTNREPFVFIIDFEAQNPEIYQLNDELCPIYWQTPYSSRLLPKEAKKQPVLWEIFPISFEQYKKGFGTVYAALNEGNSYLLNYTQPTRIKTNLTLEQIFLQSKSKYNIYYKNQFVSFSPETFVEIIDGQIASYPMKGTIDASIKNAKEQLLNDKKEAAEHATIVDLIRNDLSIVAKKVQVKTFKYIDTLTTNNKTLLQMSSEITGQLPTDYHTKIGDIIFALLPAGSISGAPKKKTVEVIKDAEQYKRGYYTGIFGIFDGKNLYSCVLIRFIEQTDNELIYKSGGGITTKSIAKKEYDELTQKIYLPLS